MFRKFAILINLVDQPNSRKHHSGSVPLIGGVAVFVVVFSYLLIFPHTISSSLLYLGCASTLLVVGVLDDLFDISFRFRLALQVVISALMMGLGGLVLSHIGDLWGRTPLDISYFGYVMTVIAVVGAINAFNMVDGIDGLLGALATITFSSMGILFYLNTQHELAAFCAVIVFATVPYILMNLGIPFGQRFKIFMGDAGSTVIGFTVVWLLLEGSQAPQGASFSPVTALWLAAVPIIDAVCTISRRVKKGLSPFRPDREHLHHILLRLGLSSRQALVVICLLALIFAGFGIFAELYNVPDLFSLVVFLIVAAIYFIIMQKIWRITVHVRRFFGVGRKH
ncbi:UDP-N-acetylglucosamine--undecaprenyl-phosphate N-acetylglucosaminephosphotransferase [Pseudoalteromonas mariniglutinosa]|uniref:UDP-N-acetylglucosamine--undecaprenyl-phosphate N-acetylglucosaminephosphotransferase n=1 Tax=Pseudoalteromonas mariniglutinosa TaxID=206042 RepID=UPI00384B99CF